MVPVVSAFEVVEGKMRNMAVLQVREDTGGRRRAREEKLFDDLEYNRSGRIKTAEPCEDEQECFQ